MYNILQDRLREVDKEIAIMNDNETRDRGTITELRTRLNDTQDFDERTRIDEQILTLTRMLPQYLSSKNALREDKNRIRDKLDALDDQANQSRKSTKHKRTLRFTKHTILSARVISSLSKSCSFTGSHPVFFIDSMLYD